jgi:hypothetical protein
MTLEPGSVADPNPGSGVFLTSPGLVKKQDPDPGMNIPDHISQSLETIFWVKVLTFFDLDPDPGPGKEKIGSGIRDKHPGSATLEPGCQTLKTDPQLWRRGK